MRIQEITDSDKSFLKLKGIEHDFDNFYNDILTYYKMVGNDPSFIVNFKQYISLLQNKMETLFAENIPNNDHDIIRIRAMHDNLENIKNSL